MASDSMGMIIIKMMAAIRHWSAKEECAIAGWNRYVAAENIMFMKVICAAKIPMRVTLRICGIYGSYFALYTMNEISDAIMVTMITMIKKDMLLPALRMKLASGMSDFYAGYSVYPPGMEG